MMLMAMAGAICSIFSPAVITVSYGSIDLSSGWGGGGAIAVLLFRHNSQAQFGPTTLLLGPAGASGADVVPNFADIGSIIVQSRIQKANLPDDLLVIERMARPT